MKRVLLIGAALLLATAVPARALPVLDFQIGAHYLYLTSDLAQDGEDDAYDDGYGAYARMRAPIGPARLAGAVTWNRFNGNDDVDDVDFLTFQAGPHYSFAVVDVGVELAWIGEFEEVGYSPVVSVAVLKFEATAAYTAGFDTDGLEWVTLGVGWRF